MAFNLEQALRDASVGGVVSVPQGRYEVNLLVDKPVSIVGIGEVILDGCKEGPVLRVRAQGTVRLGGLTIIGGRTPMAGGGVALLEGELELLQCALRFNEAPVHGGGALYVKAGQARAAQCRFEGNTGRQGGALLVDGEGRLTLKDCLVAQNAALEGGGLLVKEAGAADALGCTFADNRALGEAGQGSALALYGTLSRSPSLALSHCVVADTKATASTVFNFETHPGRLTATRTLFPEACRSLGGDNLFGAPAFAGGGAEPYFLTSASPAAGAGLAAAFEAKERDVLGNPRLAEARAPDLGAFSLGR